MGRMIRLAPDEWPAHRPFTDPALVTRDCEIMLGMIRDLHASRTARSRLAPPAMGRDRLIVTRAGRVHGDAAVTIVGFFGERRSEAAQEIAYEVETMNARMVSRFEEFPLLLGYVSRLLDDGFNYANLVALAADVGIEQWRDLPDHVPAATQVAPQFYTSVRIYNGSIPYGLGCSEHLRLRVVKYWDYQDNPVWHAERLLESMPP